MLTGQAPMVPTHISVVIFMTAESFAQSLKKALDTSGCHSTVVTTESAALAEVNASVPSLIILDRQSASIATFRRMSTLNTVPIVAVQAGNLPCPDEHCLPEYDQDVDLVVCNQSVR